jgi:pyruvate dehydrogenase E1 component beta subunit
MTVMNMVQAINSGLDYKLANDPDVVIFGEDIGVNGGVFRVTDGMQAKYGEKRVFDTPLAESGIVGTGIGMAVAGLRPVMEMQFSGFSYPALNQIISHAARMRNRSRSLYSTPIVIRMPYGGGVNAPEHHSESLEAIYGHIPGLKVVIPSTPHDAKGLIISAIESDDTVIFMEPKRIYRAIKQQVSEEEYTIPIGKANVLNKGNDITLVAYGAMIRECQRAMALAKRAGISVELIDLRTIYPMDKETIIKSVKKTGRIISVAEGPMSFGVGAEITAVVNEGAFLHLEAPPKRVAGFDTIVPMARGEKLYLIDPDRIFYEIENTVNF